MESLTVEVRRLTVLHFEETAETTFDPETETISINNESESESMKQVMKRVMEYQTMGDELVLICARGSLGICGWN